MIKIIKFYILIFLTLGVNPLANMVFAQSDMTSIQMTRSCNKCNLSNKAFQMADFSSVYFSEVNFNGSNLQNTNFSNSTIKWTSFINSDLKTANFSMSSLGNSGREQKWHNADLRGAIFRGAKIWSNDFLDAQLSGANFSDSEIKSTVFLGDRNGKVIRQIDFSNVRAYRNNVYMTGKFEVGSFVGVQMRIQSMRSGDYSFRSYPILEMININFDGAKLKDSDFKDANLKGSSFKYADLRGVNFRNADLSDVNFTGADLTNADIFGAKLCNTTGQNGNILFGGC
tara:strand:- start:350 stop:1201 length:852 start_codon:yes stop_codon:yes gene_type:complete